MITEKDILVEEQRRIDLMGQARKQRLIQQVMGHNAESIPVYKLLLARLGQQLTAWGLQLQTKYSALTETPTAVSSRSSQAQLER